MKRQRGVNVNEEIIGKILATGVGALVFIALAVQSGVLPLAILLGVVVFGATILVTQKWKTASFLGGFATLAVSALGIGAMLASG